MDDVLADFTSAFKERKNGSLPYPQSKYGFFLGLKPIPGGLDAIKTLRTKYDVWILTRPSVLNPLCYTEKRVWVENHLGMEMVERLIISPDKSLLKGDYLIDDHQHPGFEGELIQFGKEPYHNWQDVLNYLM
jgi:5'(3')-deoxyribonucleotidase